MRKSPTRRHTQHAAGTALEVVYLPLHELRPFPGNPRLMCESEMAKLMRSIQQFGMVEPLVVRRSDRLVVGGNQRLEAARALGLEQAPVVLVELSDAEAKALNLALNKIQGTWDLPRLGPSPTWAASTGDLHLAHPRHAGGRARCLRP